MKRFSKLCYFLSEVRRRMCGRIAPAASRKRGRSADGLDASQFAAVLAAAWARPARVRGGLGAIKDGHSQVAAAGHAAGPVPGGAGGSPPWAAVPVSEAHSNWANCRSGPLADRAVAHSLKRQQVSDADIQTLRTGRLLVRRSDPARRHAALPSCSQQRDGVVVGVASCRNAPQGAASAVLACA